MMRKKNLGTTEQSKYPVSTRMNFSMHFISTFVFLCLYITEKEVDELVNEYLYPVS